MPAVCWHQKEGRSYLFHWPENPDMVSSMWCGSLPWPLFWIVPHPGRSPHSHRCTVNCNSKPTRLLKTLKILTYFGGNAYLLYSWSKPEVCDQLNMFILGIEHVICILLLPLVFTCDLHLQLYHVCSKYSYYIWINRLISHAVYVNVWWNFEKNAFTSIICTLNQSHFL